MREVAIVAAALLLPVPLLAATGLRLPLPAAVERGLASVTPGGSLEMPSREAAPGHQSAASAEPSGGGGAETSSAGGGQASSSVFAGGSSSSTVRDTRDADRPRGGPTEPPAPQPPDTGSDDAPSGDSPEPLPPQSPPTEPDIPPGAPAPAQASDEPAGPPDVGGALAKVEDLVDEAVPTGDLLPPTTLPPTALPLPLP